MPAMASTIALEKCILLDMLERLLNVDLVRGSMNRSFLYAIITTVRKRMNQTEPNCKKDER